VRSAYVPTPEVDPSHNQGILQYVLVFVFSVYVEDFDFPYHNLVCCSCLQGFLVSPDPPGHICDGFGPSRA